jgi:hypothetical protein
LLGGFNSDALPPRDASLAGAHNGTVGLERDDLRDADLCRLFDEPVAARGAGERAHDGDRHRGLGEGRERCPKRERDTAADDSRDASLALVAVSVEDGERCAGAQAQHVA